MPLIGRESVCNQYDGLDVPNMCPDAIGNTGMAYLRITFLGQQIDDDMSSGNQSEFRRTDLTGRSS